jgi:hypothetical protein
MFTLIGLAMVVTNTTAYLDASIHPIAEYPIIASALYAPPREETPEMIDTATSHVNPSPEAILSELRLVFGDTLTPYFYQLALCESHLKQWDDNGNTIISKTQDGGILQINIPLWNSKASELSLDYLNDWRDNMRMAKYIYDQQGRKAWMCNDLI